MLIEFINTKTFPINSFQSEKHLEERNGKVTKDIEITEYQQNGNLIIKGHFNKKPIYYKKRITPKFRKKHVHFNLGKIIIPNKINRTLTPFIHNTGYPINKKRTIKDKITLISKLNDQIKTRKMKTRKHTSKNMTRHMK